MQHQNQIKYIISTRIRKQLKFGKSDRIKFIISTEIHEQEQLQAQSDQTDQIHSRSKNKKIAYDRKNVKKLIKKSPIYKIYIHICENIEEQKLHSLVNIWTCMNMYIILSYIYQQQIKVYEVNREFLDLTLEEIRSLRQNTKKKKSLWRKQRICRFDFKEIRSLRQNSQRLTFQGEVHLYIAISQDRVFV